MDRVEPTFRAQTGSAPPVGAAARSRRLERDQERERDREREGASDPDGTTDGGPDDGLPHVDVLA